MGQQVHFGNNFSQLFSGIRIFNQYGFDVDFGHVVTQGHDVVIHFAFQGVQYAVGYFVGTLQRAVCHTVFFGCFDGFVQFFGLAGHVCHVATVGDIIFSFGYYFVQTVPIGLVHAVIYGFGLIYNDL